MHHNAGFSKEGIEIPCQHSERSIKLSGFVIMIAVFWSYETCHIGSSYSHNDHFLVTVRLVEGNV